MKYNIERIYYNDPAMKEVVMTGLTLEQAQAHCKDPETSSSRCTNAEGLARTAAHGMWMDTYVEQTKTKRATPTSPLGIWRENDFRF